MQLFGCAFCFSISFSKWNAGTEENKHQFNENVITQLNFIIYNERAHLNGYEWLKTAYKRII